VYRTICRTHQLFRQVCNINWFVCLWVTSKIATQNRLIARLYLVRRRWRNWSWTLRRECLKSDVIEPRIWSTKSLEAFYSDGIRYLYGILYHFELLWTRHWVVLSRVTGYDEYWVKKSNFTPLPISSKILCLCWNADYIPPLWNSNFAGDLIRLSEQFVASNGDHDSRAVHKVRNGYHAPGLLDWEPPSGTYWRIDPHRLCRACSHVVRSPLWTLQLPAKLQ
jgi:hypothetical protein